ncbi:DUF6702 family protein [Salinimicrobium soli]|uniref:DUF6702 family protein n=1 Tax=Salinimicrobium soli TaxID=1254399 RepID=UPI003AB0E3CD
MKKYFLLFIAFLPLLSFAVHKFYVSQTDVVYNEKTKSVEVISHVFIDDMEQLLQERYSKELFLVKGEEHPQAESYIEKYFLSKLLVSVNGKQRELNYIGKEYKNDQLVLYLEAEKVERPNSISVENIVLSDIFPEQKNVVKVEYNGDIKSLLLSRDKPEGSLIFSE